MSDSNFGPMRPTTTTTTEHLPISTLPPKTTTTTPENVGSGRENNPRRAEVMAHASKIATESAIDFVKTAEDIAIEGGSDSQANASSRLQHASEATTKANEQAELAGRVYDQGQIALGGVGEAPVANELYKNPTTTTLNQANSQLNTTPTPTEKEMPEVEMPMTVPETTITNNPIPGGF